MSEKCKYVAIDGTEIRFGEDGKLFMGQGDLRSYSWIVNSPYGYISSFGKDDVVTKNGTIYISGSIDEVKNTANQILSIFEKDIRYKNEHPFSNETGRLYIGDCYLKCFITSSTPSAYLTHRHFLKKDITLVTDSPEWIKEVTSSFSNIIESTGTKKYPYKYPYTYRSNISSEIINNDFAISSNFEVIIEPSPGHSIANPFFEIGSRNYRFNITLQEGEKLKINSLAKAILKIDAAGNETDVLYVRNKEYDVFAKIPSGEHMISVSDNALITITLLQERSEPEWI